MKTSSSDRNVLILVTVSCFVAFLVVGALGVALVLDVADDRVLAGGGLALSAAAASASATAWRRALRLPKGEPPTQPIGERRRGTQEYHRLLVESVPAIFYVDAGTEPWTPLYISPQIEEVLGFTAEQVAGETSVWINQIHPSDRSRVMAERAHHLSTGDPLESEYRVYTRDGDLRWVSDRATVVHDEAGRTLFSQGAIFDVTPTQRVAERLRLMESIVVHASEAVVCTEAAAVDANGDRRIVYVNDAFTRSTGYTADEVLGQPVSILPGRHTTTESLERINRKLARGERGSAELFGYRKDGSEQWIEITINPVFDRDGVCTHYVSFRRDITKRKKEDERVRKLLRNAGDVVWVVSNDGRIKYASESIEHVLGFTLDDLVDRKLSDLVGPDDAFTAAEMLQEIVAGEAIGGPVEWRIRHKDGSWRYLEMLATDLRDDPDIEGVVVNGHDVTQRREAEEAVRESEERYRTIVETTREWIWAIDVEGRHIYSNPAVESILGYSPEELVGKNALDFVHPEDREWLIKSLPRWTQEKAGWSDLVIRWRHNEGTYRYLESNSMPILNAAGELLGWRGADRDVTERIKAERVLREAEHRFRSAFDNAPFGMALVGLEGEFLQVNPALCAQLGYSEQELCATDLQSLTHSEDLNDWLEPSGDLLAGEVDSSLRMQRYIHQNGHEVYTEARISLVRSDFGEPMYFVMQIEDVTERNRLEEQLRQSQKLEAVGQLAGGIAHDFNNLLTVIQSYARFVMESLERSDPAYQDADEIVKAGDRAAGLVRQLLAFSRREITHLKVVNINDAIADIDKLLRRTIGEDILLLSELTASIWRIKIDPANLEQIIMNLVLNARDAMPVGGKLTIQTENRVVGGGTTSLPAGRYVAMKVSDTGRGMTREVVDRAFEPFFTTKSRARGTGLGLSTVYGIVQQSGGAIFIDSEPERGSTFEVFLPATDELDDVQPDEPSASPMHGQNEKVLVAEDEEGVRKIVSRVLTRNGYNVLLAESGPAALELLRTTGAKVDLLLSDVIMPQMSGPDLAEAVVAGGATERVLYMSGYPGETIAHHGVFDEDDGYLKKPFTAEELLAKVRDALDSAPYSTLR